MVQKRQLADEEHDVSPKHLKLENSCQLVSCLEFPAKNVPLKPCNPGIAEDRFSKEISESDCQFENAYSRLLRCHPLKVVPIGPDYQANLPEWCESDTKNEANKFMGFCVITMPESDTTVCNDDVVGRGRSCCFCEDSGSIRCIRQHIREARESLRENISSGRFSELGFCNMGDDVACKWTEEDEQLFHEVVYSNPVSLGRNFWNHLADAFPSRTSKEIVSYYFNVFVLQRRAEQNRFDPANADSDDDEWQGGDPSEEYGSGHDKDMDISQCGGDCDFQDDSCTSSGIEPQSGHEFIYGPADHKVWDVGFFSFPRNKTDFLSTGCMIEEVFGVDSWNIEVADNNKGSSSYD